MPRQANGTYQPPAGTDAVSGATISSSAYNTQKTDFGTEITNSLDRGGRGGMTANLNMGSNLINYLAAPSIGTDAANKTYVDTTTTAAVGALSATLGTAATKNTGTTANTVPLLDADGKLTVQKVAGTAGWGLEVKSVGVLNGSGISFDASNNSDLGLRDGAGIAKVVLRTNDPNGHLIDGLPAYLCRAWVNFNGTGTVAIRASGNVSSITDNGTGDYTVNFTTALPDANYAASLTAKTDGVTDVIAQVQSSTAKATSSIRVLSINAAGGSRDAQSFDVAIFR